MTHRSFQENNDSVSWLSMPCDPKLSEPRDAQRSPCWFHRLDSTGRSRGERAPTLGRISQRGATSKYTALLWLFSKSPFHMFFTRGTIASLRVSEVCSSAPRSTKAQDALRERCPGTGPWESVLLLCEHCFLWVGNWHYKTVRKVIHLLVPVSSQQSHKWGRQSISLTHHARAGGLVSLQGHWTIQAGTWPEFWPLLGTSLSLMNDNFSVPWKGKFHFFKATKCTLWFWSSKIKTSLIWEAFWQVNNDTSNLHWATLAHLWFFWVFSSNILESGAF